MKDLLSLYWDNSNQINFIIIPLYYSNFYYVISINSSILCYDPIISKIKRKTKCISLKYKSHSFFHWFYNSSELSIIKSSSSSYSYYF
jgi:hypothetical protein